MLDALIRQLPGVELKDDGRILVNGRYVENLLLNGEDFFKGEPSVMLENLLLRGQGRESVRQRRKAQRISRTENR